MNKKNLLYILLCMFLSISLSGCSWGRELNDLTIVAGIGIDKTYDNNILLTAQIVKPGSTSSSKDSSGSTDNNKKFWNSTISGNTIFECVRKITHKTGNRLFVSHCQVIVFGNELAQHGIQEYMDFFLRASEFRPTTLILVSNSSAYEILDIEPKLEELPVMNIAKITKEYIFTSEYKKINIKDFSTRLMSKTTSPVAPLIGIDITKNKKELMISGMAVFKNGKVVGTLSPFETEGLLWLTNEIESGLIKLSSKLEQSEVVFEILNAKTKVIPEIKNDKIFMNVTIDAESSLAEQNTLEDLLKVPTLKILEEKQEDVIREKILASFEKSKELNSDIFGFGDKIHKRYKTEWKQLENNWDNIYSNIIINTNINVKIRKTNLITKPAIPEKEGK